MQELDLISATDNGSVQTYFLHERLGSMTELADEDGTVVGTYAYDAFGSVRAHTGSVVRRQRSSHGRRIEASFLYTSLRPPPT